ncbi:MAG TPA: hypothetical protein VLB82_02695 [Thermodesulfobacteriota bacterium]|nr:hypothetical protein [Thermodesulfobacteriota bacterium]
MKTKYNITEINPETIKQIRQIIKDSLSDIMEDNNLRFELGNGSYDSDSVKFNGFIISLSDAKTEEEKALESELDFRQTSPYAFNLDASIIATEGSRKFKLVGFKKRARKKPFVIQDIKTNDKFVCSESMAVRLFRANS